jgi:hypothetical protein
MDEGRGHPLAIGGMDAGIEDLLFDAGGVWLEADDARAEPEGPWVTLAFGAGRSTAVDHLHLLCVEHGWAATRGAQGAWALVRVQERVAARVFALLARMGVGPDAVVVRASDLTPSHVRGIREALPVETRFEIDGSLDDRPPNRP